MTSERIEVQRPIPAAAADIFKIVSDPAGHVAIDATGMLQSFTGEPATKVGDEFVIHMDREALNDYPLGKYDVTVQITTFEQDKEIAWTIDGQLKPAIGHIYGYRLDPGEEEGTTLVTEYYDWSDIHPDWKERNIFPIISELAIRATLGILERTVRVGLPPGLRAVTKMDRLEAIVAKLPEADRVDIEAWGGEPTFRVRGKNFIFCAHDASGISVKLPKEEAAAVVATDPTAEPTGYGLGRHGWVSVTIGKDTKARWQQVEEWVRTSYTMVAPKKLAQVVLDEDGIA